MPAGQKIGYIPRGKRERGFFPTSLFSYYMMARFIGYVAQTIDKPVTDWLEKNALSSVREPKKWAQSCWGLFEASAFALVIVTSFFNDKKQFKSNLYDAIAAERGMNPADVDLFSMYKSDNPFIRTVRNRFSFQQAFRAPVALAFAKNIKVGIFAFIVNFTLERSWFVENNAYDIMRNMIYEVQELKIDPNKDMERLLEGFPRAVQRTLADNNRPGLTIEELRANKPVFEALARNILNDRFSNVEAVYILGEMANYPDRTAQMLSDIEKMEQRGIKEFARQKAGLQVRKPATQAALLEAKRELISRSQPSGHSIAGAL